MATLVAVCMTAACGSSGRPDDLAFRTSPTAVVGTWSTKLGDLPLNDPLVLAEQDTIESTPTATPAQTNDAGRAAIVVSTDGAPVNAAAQAKFETATTDNAITSGFIVYHPTSCGLSWLTDPAGDSWRVVGSAPGSFEPPADWLPRIAAADEVRLVATSTQNGTVLVHPDGVTTTVEYRATPARVFCR